MSTYLLAILVADYKCLNGVSNTVYPPAKAVDVAVCARPNAFDQLDLAFEASVKILEFFDSFYQAKYPLPKLDHVASPTFAYGGKLTIIFRFDEVYIGRNRFETLIHYSYENKC